MKITDVEAIHINPRLAARNDGHEVRFAGIDTQTVFRITTDKGIIGYGESRGHVTVSDTDIDTMIGRSPADFLASDLATGLVGAIYDTVGKYLEVPAYKLIGPKVRDRVPVAAWTRPASPEDFARELQRAVDEGTICSRCTRVRITACLLRPVPPKMSCPLTSRSTTT